MEKIRLCRGGKDGEPSKVVFRCVREVADVCRSDDAALGPVKGHRNQGREQSIQSGLRHLHEEHPKANRRKKQRLPLARWKNGGQSTNRLVPGSVSTRQGSTAFTTSLRWGFPPGKSTTEFFANSATL